MKIQRLKEVFLEKGYTFYFHLYLKEIGFLKILLLEKIKLDTDICKFHKLSSTEVARLSNKSHIVIDLANKNQTGQTMRVFETMGSNNKLLSTHPLLNIEEYYNKDMMKFLDTNSLFIEEDWINKTLNYDKMTIEKYSIKVWIKELLKDPEFK